jgi:hypothetical protein
LSLAALAFGIAPDPWLPLPATSTVDGILEFITCLAGQFASAVAGLHEAGARLLHGLAGNLACLALNMRVARGSHQGPNDQSAEQHWTFPLCVACAPKTQRVAEKMPENLEVVAPQGLVFSYPRCYNH